MYVDDVMLACHMDEAETVHDTIESVFRQLMGAGSLAPVKKETGRRLVLIGWLVCLDTLTVQPSRPITIHSLFAITLDEAVPLKTLQTIASRCERFLTVAPFISPFLQAMYNDIARFRGDMSVRHRLSVLARQDVLLWRSFLLMKPPIPKNSRPLSASFAHGHGQ